MDPDMLETYQYFSLTGEDLKTDSGTFKILLDQDLAMQEHSTQGLFSLFFCIGLFHLALFLEVFQGKRTRRFQHYGEGKRG